MIQGKKVFLRRMTPEDTDLIVKWRNESFVRENFIYQKPFTREGHLNWIRTQVETGHVVQFIICRTQNGEPIGSVYFRDIDREHRKAEYGIFIGEESALGQGFGTETAQLAIRYAFEELGLHKLMLRVLAGNERARRSYEHAGFTEEAVLKDDVYIQGQYRDVILMRILENEIR